MTAVSQSAHKGLSAQEVVLLCETLDSIRRAGVPLDFGLTQSVASVPPRLGETLRRLAESVSHGVPLEEALDREEQIPPMFRAIFVIGLQGEGAGRLLSDVAETSRHLIELRLTLRRGFVYPLLVVLVALALTSVLVTNLLPQLVGTYELLRVPLPPWAATVQRLDGELANRLALGAGILIALILARLFWSAISANGLPWDCSSLLPGFGRILQNVRSARLAHLLALFVDHGMPLPQALRLAAQAVGSPRYRTALEQMAGEIESGRPFDASVGRRPLPPLLRWLMVVGQRDSRLGTTLREAGDMYRDRAVARAEWMSRLVPAAAVVVLGGGVTLCYALMLFGPLTELWGNLGRP